MFQSLFIVFRTFSIHFLTFLVCPQFDKTKISHKKMKIKGTLLYRLTQVLTTSKYMQNCGCIWHQCCSLQSADGSLQCITVLCNHVKAKTIFDF